MYDQGRSCNGGQKDGRALDEIRSRDFSLVVPRKCMLVPSLQIKTKKEMRFSWTFVTVRITGTPRPLRLGGLCRAARHAS